MLRVRDIFPQAASGSLADVVGSCVGSHRPASGCLVCFCCWSGALPALSSWILFPLAALGLVKLYSVQIPSAISGWTLYGQKSSRSLQLCLMISWIVRIGTKETQNQTRTFLLPRTILFLFLGFTLSTGCIHLAARMLAKWFCVNTVFCNFDVINVIFKAFFVSP